MHTRGAARAESSLSHLPASRGILLSFSLSLSLSQSLRKLRTRYLGIPRLRIRVRKTRARARGEKRGKEIHPLNRHAYAHVRRAYAPVPPLPPLPPFTPLRLGADGVKTVLPEVAARDYAGYSWLLKL